ncbi:hypothetical protein [Xanthomonas sp. 60]
MSLKPWSSLLCLALAACSQLDTPGGATANEMRAPGSDGDHMVSINVADAPPPAPPPALDASDRPWPAAMLENGVAHVSCTTDYAGEEGDGVLLEGLSRPQVEAALQPCAERGLVRARYSGKINPGFAEMMWRLAAVAEQAGIHKRILDLDSSGGQVESAIVAGDGIGETGWTLWIREGSICHSACVFVLAAGDNRLVMGKVGIHRMMRISSKATSRAELNRELHEVYDNVKDYLQRNGVAVGVADLMMTVPNRSLRLLSGDELRQFGLDGTNAVQDDLERIRQMRSCGDDFVRRKDAFLVAFDQQCKREGAEMEAVNECGQSLKAQYGFPDEQCPRESPLSEIDVATLPPAPNDGAPAAAAAGIGQQGPVDADAGDGSAR